MDISPATYNVILRNHNGMGVTRYGVECNAIKDDGTWVDFFHQGRFVLRVRAEHLIRVDPKPTA